MDPAIKKSRRHRTPNYVRQIATATGLTLTQARELLENPERFIVGQLRAMRAAHIGELDDILAALEKRAKNGDVKAAQAWLAFIGKPQAEATTGVVDAKPSSAVKTGVSWLPTVTVEPAKPINPSTKPKNLKALPSGDALGK